MTDWLEAYAAATDPNRQYELLREEMTRLRAARAESDFFDDEAVARDVSRSNETVAGDLIVFVANDFGRPRAYRPDGVALDAQDDIRQAVLQRKYDDSHERLNEIRSQLLDRHAGMHKAIVAEYGSDDVSYHLPEGSNETTSFLTVREMVGLIDYTTNSAQREALSRTY